MIQRTSFKSSNFLADIHSAQAKNSSNYALDRNTKQFLFYNWSSACWDQIDLKKVASNLGTLNVQEVSFDDFNNKIISGCTYYLSSKGCALVWNNLSNDWHFEHNFINNLEFVHKVRAAYYLRDNLYSFEIPDLKKTRTSYEKLKNLTLSIANDPDSSEDLAHHLEMLLPAMCPCLHGFLKSRFSYYNNGVVQKDVVN